MTWPLRLDSDRFFPADPATRSLAQRLFAEVERVPILSPHCHCDPAWFAFDQPFEDAVSLLLWPDHYILRLLFGIDAEMREFGQDGINSVVPPAIDAGGSSSATDLPVS